MIKRRLARGFSLVEVTLAIGVVGFALIAIFALVPVGMKSGRESIDATRTSLIAQNAINRIRGSLVSSDPAYTQRFFGPDPAGSASFFFYDSQGVATGELLRVQSPGDQPQFYPNITTPADFYRVKVTISNFSQSGAYPIYDPRYSAPGNAATLLCGTVEVAWPINTQTGSVLSAGSQQKVTQTLVLRKP